MNKKAIISIFLAGMFILGGCGSKKAATDNSQVANSKEIAVTRGGEMKLAITGDPKTLFPIFYDDTNSGRIVGFMFDSLLTYDEKSNLIPELAEKMPTVSADNKEITVNLKKGVKWHDGTEMTADDVKYSYDLILDKAVNSPRRNDFLAVSNMDVVDKYTVKFTLSKPDSELMDNLATPRIIPKHIVEKLDRAKLKESDFARNPVGNGAFKFVEWKSNERIVLEVNPDYYKGKPGLDKITALITPSSTTALLKVETGEADIVSVPEADMERMQKIQSITVNTYNSSSFDCIQYNVGRPFFSDVRVRQAMSYAVNRDALISGIYKGNAVPTFTSYPPTLWAHNPNVQKYNYDVEKAKKLLDEAGWKVGADGIREKDGQKFEFELLTNKGNVAREKMVVYLQNAYKEVGINAKPSILEFNTLFGKYVDVGNFDAFLGGYSAGTGIIHQTYYAKDGVFNTGNYLSPRIDELFDKIRGTFNKDEQKKYVFEVQQIVSEELPMTYLVNRKAATAVSKKIKNAKFYDMVGWYDVYKWYKE